MKVRIVLLADEKLDKLAKDFSGKISEKFPSNFTLDETHIPHVTLLHATFLDENFEKVVEGVKKASEDEKAIYIRIKQAQLGGYVGFLGVYFEDESGILKLKEKISGAIGEYVSNFTPLIASHLTLTRLKSDDPSALDLANSFPKEDFKLTAVAVCEEGLDGTCVRVLASFPLNDL